MASPRSASDRTVRTPAFSSAANFSSAVPLPPEMIAPAWPMRLPGGAVTPAMKPTTGFFTSRLMNSAASSSAGAADLADHDDAFGLRIVLEQLEAVDEVRAVDRVAADADARCSGRARVVVWSTAS